MADESLLREGIEAVRAGNRDRGRTLLSKVVLENPDSEAAWWYLGLSVDDNQHRLYCFKKVLALNPDHKGARARLGLAPTFESGRTAGQPKSARRGRQTVILVFLGIFTLLVVIGGGGYVFLDSMGYMEGSLSEAFAQLLSGAQTLPTATLPPTQGPAPTEASTSASLSSIPTWTPTPSPTLKLPTPTSTATLPPTPELPTEQPPTPESLPSPNNAITVDLNDGTGTITLFPEDFEVYRFEPSATFTLQFVASLTHHLYHPDAPLPLTLELYIWNISDGSWDVYGERWGDSVIPQPSVYVSSDGVVIAAFRNWGSDPVTATNISFTFSGRTNTGQDIFYGLNRDIIRSSTQQAATPTTEFSD